MFCFRPTVCLLLGLATGPLLLLSQARGTTVIDDFSSPIFEDIIDGNTGLGREPQSNMDYSISHELSRMPVRRSVVLGTIPLSRHRAGLTAKIGLRPDNGGELYVDSELFAERLSLSWAFETPLNLVINPHIHVDFGRVYSPEASKLTLSMFLNDATSVGLEPVSFADLSGRTWTFDTSPYALEHDLTTVNSLSLSNLGFEAGSEFIIRELRVVPEPGTALLLGTAVVLWGLHRRLTSSSPLKGGHRLGGTPEMDRR